MLNRFNRPAFDRAVRQNFFVQALKVVSSGQRRFAAFDSSPVEERAVRAQILGAPEGLRTRSSNLHGPGTNRAPLTMATGGGGGRMSDMDDTYNPDEDTYSGDEWTDTVLLYAPDEQRLCGQCGGFAYDEGSGPQHVTGLDNRPYATAIGR